jgi:DNA primase catalytic core
MARIPEAEIERLKKEVPIERLVMGFGVELKRHGAELIGTCPFHEDKTPSLVVSPKTNLWHCLGKCNVGGSTIDWVMKTKGVSFRHAVELLRADHPSLAAGDGHVVKKGTTAKLDAPVSADADDRDALRQVVDFYHATLKESPEALRYLESRGLAHPEMIERFQIGFSNRTLGYRLPDRNRKEGAELRGRLQRLGIIRESGHEHFMGSIVFPVLSLDGDVTEIYGRKITAGLRTGTPLHTYLPGPHRGVWNEEALIASKEIILCESIIDALTFWCAGFRNVTASYGVNGFTEDHKAAFAKHGVKNAWIAYDRDEAGDAAAERLKEELAAMGIGSHRVLFPRGLDANEYARTGASLAVLLNGAEWLSKSEQPAPVIPLAADPLVMVNGDEITLQREDRRYRVRGLGKNTTHEIMRVNVLVSLKDDFHIDTFDLNADRQRIVFIKRAAEELHVKEDVIRKDIGCLFRKLEEVRDELVKRALTPAKPEVILSDDERAEALAFLKDPKLLDRIVEDFERCGLVGEVTNKKIAYLAAVSRHLDSPLAVVVQSSSAAGKSTLMDAALAFVPEEERIQFSAMTGQSLYYMELDLKHKVLAIVEEEGASKAAYALKLLQSEGALSIASTGKDPSTGKLVTHQYRVEGPVMMFLTTTAIDIDEELLNRCLVLSVDEDREQTQAIHRMQREAQTLEGLLKREERRDIIRLHQNAQRLLRPLFVANPFAGKLTFLDRLTRTRRDHAKYLTLIRAIALLHQHQRPVRTATRRGKTMEYIEVTREDLEVANALTVEIMGRSLDELPPQTRRLLSLIGDYVKGECTRLNVDRADFRFSRRDVRTAIGWNETQLRLHLDRLQQMEYLLAHRGGRGQSFVYELVHEPGQTHFIGLIDVYDGHFAGSGDGFAPGSRGQSGGIAGASRVTETRMNIAPNGVFHGESEKRTDMGA